MTEPGADELARFREWVALRLGLSFEEEHSASLLLALESQLERTGETAERYLERLRSTPSTLELSAIAERLTVSETYFFRNIEQFHAYQDVVSRPLGATGRPIRVLSAGCSSGEEAYTLAILARDEAALTGETEVRIRALDINPAIIERAKRGRFGKWSFRETPAYVRSRWFRSDGAEFVLDERIRARVEFHCHNLTVDDAELFAECSYDAIFCRNVLMYLTPEAMRQVVARLTRALTPDGFLFLGHAETLRNISNDFNLCHSHGTFYYRKRPHSELAAVAKDSRVVPLTNQPLMGPEGSAWVDLIGQATDRVHRLHRRAASTSDPPDGRLDLSVALDHLRNEQFALALDAVRTLPKAWAEDPDALILEAVLLAHGGQLSAAEEVCHRLLLQDDMNAGAHYLLALCREGHGDPAGTLHHDRIAMYLDGTFAMPHLHLGLLLRRLGDAEAACVELTLARRLLQGEDAARLLLFGGGFGRSALLGLCDLELKACRRSA
jgi:chemotaxis protein methyltransferase CheR